ncbi:hypothetical protein Tco_0963241 [Tanacetum coccineum]
MACSLSHTIDENQALVYKLMDEDKARQNAIAELAMQFDNAITSKDDLRKAYEKCNDISQESHALIDTFLKKESDKDYEMHLSMFGKAAKIEKQIETEYVWRLRTEQEKEYQLVNNLLGEITRYMIQKLDRAEEETRVRSLPFDEPLKTFSVQTLHLSSELDTRISNILEAAREKVLASINKKEELIKNYRAI